MSSRELTFFVSDVHLGLDVADAAAREARFQAFLDGIPEERTEALYLLGDIWDFWYEYKDVVPCGYAGIFSRLKALTDAGVKVYFMPGNHDIWAYGYFRRFGVEIIKDRWIVRDIAGKTFCLSHGDGLGRGMYGYKFMRAIFHGRIFQILFSMLHPRIAFGIGKAWSKRSRLAKRVKYQFKGESEPLYKWAEKIAASQKIDYFVFGHYHCAWTGVLSSSGSSVNLLGDWLEGAPYLYFSPKSGMSGSLPNIEK